MIAARGAPDAILVLVGANAKIDDSDELFQLLPLLAWSFHKESQALSSTASVALAREKEDSANLLAKSLDRARAKLAAALVNARRAEEALRVADQRKDEFLALLAHELRNPLAPLGNGIALLAHAEKQPHMLPKVRKMMSNQLRQMSRLIDDLMDVSRITRGKLKLQIQPVTVEQVINSAIEAIQPTLEKQRHKLQVRMPDEPLVLQADGARLSQVFANLLNNAAKYTAPGGSIEVAIEAKPLEVVISIKDTGVGLDVTELDRIFDMFVQIDRSTDDAHGGLGIGLTLVKNLVEMHDGHVVAKSNGKGCGSEFVVTLPRAESERLQRAHPTPTQVQPENPQLLKVLIVDDNEASAKSLGMLVEMMGHAVFLAFTGQDAVAKATEQKPQIIFLDIGLPDISGYEVCENLRHLPAVKHARIVAQTGWGQEEYKNRAREAGFDEFLVKPIDTKRLQEIIVGLTANT